MSDDKIIAIPKIEFFNENNMVNILNKGFVHIEVHNDIKGQGAFSIELSPNVMELPKPFTLSKIYLKPGDADKYFNNKGYLMTGITLTDQPENERIQKSGQISKIRAITGGGMEATLSKYDSYYAPWAIGLEGIDPFAYNMVYLHLKPNMRPEEFITTWLERKILDKDGKPYFAPQGHILKKFIDYKKYIFNSQGDPINPYCTITSNTPFEHSVWGCINTFKSEPFYELFWDYRDGIAYLVYRPTPFYSQNDFPYVDITGDYIFIDEKGEPNSECAEYYPKIITHDLDFNKVSVLKNLSQNEAEMKNLFFVYAQLLFMDQVEFWQYLNLSSQRGTFMVEHAFPLRDVKRIQQYGLRKMERTSILFPFSRKYSELAEAEKNDLKFNSLYLLARLNYRLHDNYCCNEDFLSGQIQMKYNPDIHCGEYIRDIHTKRKYYVERVSHIWNYGEETITRLSLARGIEPNQLRELVKERRNNLAKYSDMTEWEQEAFVNKEKEFADQIKEKLDSEKHGSEGKIVYDYRTKPMNTGFPESEDKDESVIGKYLNNLLNFIYSVYTYSQ